MTLKFNLKPSYLEGYSQYGIPDDPLHHPQPFRPWVWSLPLNEGAGSLWLFPPLVARSHA
jgi:hypothetical protein